MNFSNLSDINYDLSEKFYIRIGSTWVIDSIYIFIIAPMGFIGFMLNFVTLIVMSKIKIKQTKLYDYLILYSLNSCLICFIIGFLFLSYSPRYFNQYVFTSDIVKFYRCRVFIYGVMCLYFFGNILDLFISMDRISIFIKRLDSFRKMKPYILCFCICLGCFIVNSPLVITYELMTNQDYFTKNVTSYCTPNELGKTKYGLALNLLVILIRDILTLTFEIISSYFIIYHYKIYSIVKNVNATVAAADQIDANNLQKRESMATNRKKWTKGKKLMLMTVYLSITSFATHVIVATVFVLLVNLLLEKYPLVYFSLVCFGAFILNFKHFLNIFIFFAFNSNFRKQLKYYFKFNKK